MNPVNVSQVLVDPLSITTILLNIRDYVNIIKRIEYYALSQYVSTIIVPWCHKDYPAPRDAMIRDTMVYFVLPSEGHCSNEQLKIVIDDIRIASSAVLIVADDHDIRHDDIAMMYQVWNNYPNNVVRLMSRSLNGSDIMKSNEGKNYFQVKNMDVKERHSAGYGLDFDTAKAIMSSSALLSNLTCSDRKSLSEKMIYINY